MARILLGVLAVTMLIATSAVAQNKVVGIVFDTSGSMSNRYNLPSFGMRLLSASVDGRAGFDRLMVMNFKKYQTDIVPDSSTVDSIRRQLGPTIRKDNLATRGQHQKSVDQLEGYFRFLGGAGTPYGPIEIMLDEIADTIKAGEEAVLVVVSDGGYQMSPPDGRSIFDGRAQVPKITQSYAAYRQRIEDAGGSLSVHYLFIDDKNGGSKGTVEGQGVRDAFLQSFNGNTSDGNWYVSNEAQLWDSLKSIISEVSGTDLEAQKAHVEYSGTEIRINSPLSISRIVIVSTGPKGSPLPEKTSDDFGKQPTDTRRINAAMAGYDSDLDARARSGIVHQLTYQDAISPGNYTIGFNGPVPEKDVFLLFETSAKTEVRIFNAQGDALPVGASGRYELIVGREYIFESQILDGDSNPEVVDLDTLPAALAMFLELSGSAEQSVNSMDIDLTQDKGIFRWTPRTVGEATVLSRAAAGILSPKSKPLMVDVIDPSATIVVSPMQSVQPCPSCAAGEIGLLATPNGGAEEVGRFEVTGTSAIDGKITLNTEDLPDGYEIRDETDKVVGPDTRFDMKSGVPRGFSLWRVKPLDGADITNGIADLNVQVRPAGAWKGDPAELATQVRLEVSNMGMRLVKVTQPKTPGTIDALVVPGGELLRGRFTAEFSLTELYVAPDPEVIDDLVSFETDWFTSLLVGFTPSFPDAALTGAPALTVAPRSSYWCLCFLGLQSRVLGTEARDLTVNYHQTIDGVPLQSARQSVPIYTPVNTTQFSISCALNLLYLLLFVMFVRGIIALIWTHRFPRGSSIEVEEAPNLPRFVRLDKGNSVWWKAWFALFFGNPDEQRTVEGLRLKATARGGTVDISKSAPPWRLERLGETFAELKETRPKKTVYSLIWGDRLEHADRPALSMRLKKK